MQDDLGAAPQLLSFCVPRDCEASTCLALPHILLVIIVLSNHCRNTIGSEAGKVTGRCSHTVMSVLKAVIVCKAV